jgi:hypothetical protein
MLSTLSILILLVDDISQLLIICTHSYFYAEKCCKNCHILTPPSWLHEIHHHFNSSTRHARHPIYLQFLNIIWYRQPIQIEIDVVLLHCIISKDELLSNKDDKTTNVFTHHIDVETYNNLVLQKLFTWNRMFDVHWKEMLLNLNICNNGIKIPVLDI